MSRMQQSNKNNTNRRRKATAHLHQMQMAKDSQEVKDARLLKIVDSLSRDLDKALALLERLEAKKKFEKTLTYGR